MITLVQERIQKYNFDNINDILRNTPGVYSREETGFGQPNISIRGTATLRSTQINMLEDEINIAPAPYSAPDAYYSPLTHKMHAIEVLKGLPSIDMVLIPLVVYKLSLQHL